MKRLSYSVLILLLNLNLINAQKPEIVYSIIKENQPHSFFVKQAELWWREIEKITKFNTIFLLSEIKTDTFAVVLWSKFKSTLKCA